MFRLYALQDETSAYDRFAKPLFWGTNAGRTSPSGPAMSDIIGRVALMYESQKVAIFGFRAPQHLYLVQRLEGELHTLPGENAR